MPPIQDPSSAAWPRLTPHAPALGPALALALLPLVACQSYTPDPFDAEAHRSTWEARVETLADGAPARDEGRVELSYDEGVQVALSFHPDLRRARQDLAGRAALAAAAGTSPDPQFQSNLLRIKGPADDPWVLTPNLAFSLPLTGQTDAARAQATAAERVAFAAVLEQEWQVQRDLTAAWASWSAGRAELEVRGAVLEELASLARAADGLAAAGELARPDADAVRVALAQRRAEHARARGEVEAARARVLGTLGLAPHAPVALRPLPVDGGQALGSAGQGEAHDHPAAVRLLAEYEVCEEALRLAIARQVPDPLVGPMLESDGGQVRWGLTTGWVLPLLSGNRVAIAAAEAARGAARVELELEVEALALARAVHGARCEGLAEGRRLTAEELVPAAAARVRSARRQVELGEASVLLVLEGLLDLEEARLALVAVEEELALERAGLTWALGPAPEERSTEIER